MPRNANSSCNKYVGLSEEDAEQQIKSDGLCSRVMGRVTLEAGAEMVNPTLGLATTDLTASI